MPHSSEAALDLSRRRVAAISFLSNISIDDSVTEIRLDCLQSTHVLRDFQHKKRQRQRHLVELRRSATMMNRQSQRHYQSSPHVVHKSAKIPRKLTFVPSEIQIANLLEIEDDNTHLKPKGFLEQVEPATPNPELDEVDGFELANEINSQFASKSRGDNLLHLELSKLMDERALQSVGNPMPKSAPVQDFQQNDSTTNTTSKNEGFLFATNDRFTSTSNDHLSETKSLVNIKRKTTNSGKFDEFRNNFHGSSNESLLATTLGARLRKISGNLSENSSGNSNYGHNSREFRYVKADEEKNVRDERIVFVSNENKIPFAIFSVLQFHKSGRAQRRPSLVRLSFREKDGKRPRTSSGHRPTSSINDTNNDPMDILIGGERTDENQETSYSHLLEPTALLNEKEILNSNIGATVVKKPLAGCQSSDIGRGSNLNIKQDDSIKACQIYSPHELEGWLVAGRHRTFLPFSSHITSVIEYVRPSEMKKELNLKFRERFPNLQLSLSKLRSLKKEMRRIVLIECALDMLTVASAYVYFELLVLKGTINKANRKYCAGACLILAAKLNDVKGAALSNLIEKTESVFRLHRKDLLASEFAVLVALEFSLHVPSWHVFPHFQRLLYEN